MLSWLRANYPSLLLISFLIVAWSCFVVWTHPKNAIVSWDEGFHGGAALYLTEGLRHSFDFNPFIYIRNDFINGVIWYPPLWLLLAGGLGAVFSPSVGIFRLATLLFSILSLYLIFYFVRSIANFKAALVATVTLAFSPIFVIYSHIMMREIPLLFSVAVALIFFYRYLTKPKLSKWDVFLTGLALCLGVWSKIIGIVLIFGTVISFGILSHFLFKKSLIYQRFFSERTLFLLWTSYLVFLSYRYYTRTFLHADMIEFFLGQSAQMSSGETNLLLASAANFFKDASFYLKDSMRMLPLGIFWIGSFLGYIVWKRSIFGLYLLVWVIVTYFSFTAVKPHATQYILSIYVPIAVGVGLFWGEIFRLRSKLVQKVLYIFLILDITLLGIFYLPYSDVVVWRNAVTNQEVAVARVLEMAQPGDRVIVNGDGTRFLISLGGVDKKIQTINGVLPICPEVVSDSSDLAIDDTGPQNPIELKGLDDPTWQLLEKFDSLIRPISIYVNKNRDQVVKLYDQATERRCARTLPLGRIEFRFTGTPELGEEVSTQSVLQFAIRTNQVLPITQTTIDSDSLKGQTGKEQTYSLIFNNDQPNRWVYYTINPSNGVLFSLRRVKIRPIKRGALQRSSVFGIN